MDYVGIAKVSEDQRELVSALVAGLVSDGFTDREARVIVTGLFASLINAREKDGDT